MQIVKYPNKILRKKLDIFSDFKNPNLKDIVNEMCDLMLKSDGVGLAANQVDMEIRMITANTKEGPMVFFNPRIIKKSLIKKSDEEGCLSFPKIYGTVRRHKTIILEYEDIDGKTLQKRVHGLLAIVLQHETDHVDGILFIDKIKKFSDGKEKLEELKKTATPEEL